MVTLKPRSSWSKQALGEVTASQLAKFDEEWAALILDTSNFKYNPDETSSFIDLHVVISSFVLV